MKLTKPTEEDKEFYCKLPSYKLVNKGKETEYLTITSPDFICNIPYTSLQLRYIYYSNRSFEKGCMIGISYSQFETILSSKCVYCGDNAASVDRIDSSGCYTEDNTQPICITCNMMKHVLKDEFFRNHIIKMYNHIM